MYKILFHRLVLEEDFKKLSKTERRKIVKAIKAKLSKDPQSFGKPLTANLKGYFRLRVGIYRVIFRIKQDHVEVLVLKIGLRKDMKVYIQAAKRLGLMK